MIVRRQVRRQQTDGGQRDRPSREEIEDHRKAPRRAGCFDPPIRGVLREMKDLRAISKERRTAFAEIQATRVELREAGHQGCGGPLLVGREPLDVGEELNVGQVSDRGNLIMSLCNIVISVASVEAQRGDHSPNDGRRRLGARSMRTSGYRACRSHSGDEVRALITEPQKPVKNFLDA